MQPFKVIVEKHIDGYVAYPLGLKGVVIGQGDTYKESLMREHQVKLLFAKTYKTLYKGSFGTPQK